MKKLTKKVKKDIQEFIETNQPKIDWGCDFDKHCLKNILEKGWDDYIDELQDINLDYICDLEYWLLNEVKEQWKEYDPDEIEELGRDYIYVDMNTKHLLSKLPDITCLAVVYSNYDCCNSFDTLEPDTYLWDVYQRVKKGVKKDDFMWEFSNGAYGGSLFCFVFKTDIKDALELMKKTKTGKTITIPKGTQFGFFSSFTGSGSVFEKTTYKDITIPLDGETKYDSIKIIPDLTQSYNMADVYGCTNFIDEANITIN